MSKRVPFLLLLGYAVFFTLLAIHPHDRVVWWAENLPILAIVVAVSLAHLRVKFSPLACTLMAVLVFLHTIGGHYTFARVPFGLVTDTFGFERNHFDRVAHFSVGFYAFAFAEILHRRALTRSRFVLYSYPVFAILAVAGGYEIFEWIFAVLGDPAAGNEVLGSQGDIWDAQKDILADTLGALAAMALFALRYPASLRRSARGGEE